ncbi:MAG: sulfatase-like hydrolase/transferase [Planctomycetes bacterium]|nr:sulfatase-like hydrolase/transferase [Planctomycetota bacterium]
MNRRDFLKMCGSVAVGGVMLSNRGMDVKVSRRWPNIILCMADDQGWNETGYYDHPFLKTPVLDEMAAKGLRFDRFYSAAPNCSPTRASVMTGRHPNRCGCFGPNHSTRPEEITIAEMLKERGYATGHFGKWHLGPVKGSSFTNPGANGFDEWLSHDNFFEMSPVLVRDGGKPLLYEGESSDIVAGAAIDFIDKVKDRDQPFFVVVWFGSPHAPYEGVAKDLALYSDVEDEVLKNRFAEITAMDRAVGSLRNYLRKEELTDSTLFWYCSDNGVPGDVKVDLDLKGSKGDLYEGGIRVPAIIEWPAVIKTPAVSDVPSVTSDIMPTICELLGIDLPDRPIDGISLVGIIEGAMSSRPSPICFWKYNTSTEKDNEPWLDPVSQQGTTPTTKRESIQFANYKHPVPKTDNFGGTAAIRDSRYKLVITSKSSSETIELFDLLADPTESANQASSKPGTVDTLRAALENWQRSVERSLSGYDYDG